MALAIDTTHLAKFCIPVKQRYLDLQARHSQLYQVYRVYAHATIIHDASTARRLLEIIHDASTARRVNETPGQLVKQEALNWQADQDDDLDEVEVFTHLNHQGQTSPMFAELALSQTERTNAKVTTLVASCAVQSPSVTASAQGRPLSSFHRYSLRESILFISDRECYTQWCPLPDVIPTARQYRWEWGSYVDIVGASSKANEPAVVWHLQFDFVDLLSHRILPTSRPGKRRRTTLNPFHQLSCAPLQHSSPGNDQLPEPKRFMGVRYRRDRRTWSAEMKPPKYKNKVSFGEFKSQAQAARVVDAAFHYYGKTHLLNFSDTPHILSTRPMSPAALGEEDKLNFVKEQAKWLASMVSEIPSSPPSVPFQIPESSSRGCTPGTLGFRTFSEIPSFLSCGDADEADDAISQHQPSLHTDSGAGLVSDGLMEPNLAGIALNEWEDMFQHWNLEDVLADPCLSARWSLSSSVQITDGWDHGAELDSGAPALPNSGNSSQPCESQSTWIDSFLRSPPAPMIPVPPSPTNFQDEVARRLLEQQSFGGE